MAPGPKKKSFHTPRNTKNTQSSKTNDKKSLESSNELNKNLDTAVGVLVDSESSGNKRYSKRSVESNWIKYEEPQIDPHADSIRGNDFEVLLSYSGGSGSQLKLQDEKDWECESLNTKDISLNFQDLINSMKCIPFHERINIQNIFDEKQVKNFTSIAKKWETSYKSLSKSQAVEPPNLLTLDVDPVLTIVEEPDSLESDEITLKSFFVKEKTEDIINTLASNLTFKEIPEKVPEIPVEEKKLETTSNDLDFLLSLNISSKVTVKEESNEISKAPNVDDWLNSILDD